MPTSDEDLQKKREEAQRLREQVANEEAKRLEREREATNEIEAATLDAEIAQLKANLAAAKESAKVGVVKGGTSAPIEAAKDAMLRAQAQEQGIVDNREAQAANLAAAKEADKAATETPKES